MAIAPFLKMLLLENPYVGFLELPLNSEGHPCHTWMVPPRKRASNLKDGSYQRDTLVGILTLVCNCCSIKQGLVILTDPE